jgi:hypothetical protein
VVPITFSGKSVSVRISSGAPAALRHRADRPRHLRTGQEPRREAGQRHREAGERREVWPAMTIGRIRSSRSLRYRIRTSAPSRCGMPRMCSRYAQWTRLRAFCPWSSRRPASFGSASGEPGDMATGKRPARGGRARSPSDDVSGRRWMATPIPPPTTGCSGRPGDVAALPGAPEVERLAQRRDVAERARDHRGLSPRCPSGISVPAGGLRSLTEQD